MIKQPQQPYTTIKTQVIMLCPRCGKAAHITLEDMTLPSQDEMGARVLLHVKCEGCGLEKSVGYDWKVSIEVGEVGS